MCHLLPLSRKSQQRKVFIVISYSAVDIYVNVNRAVSQDSDDDDDAPEVMHAQNLEVMMLKQQHEDEDAIKPKSAKKRRKAKKQEDEDEDDTATKEPGDNDMGEMLDDSVFDAVMQYQEAMTDEEDGGKAVNKKSGMGKITIRKENSRKM